MESVSDITNTNLLQNFNTKDRSVNFSKSEVLRLKALVEKYKNILLCKKTDGTSTKQKEKAWINIEIEYNATSQIPRTMKQLKYKFENMKRTAKKEATRERQEMRRTGGGKPLPPPPGAEDATDWLRSVMSGSIEGNESLYDDDMLVLNSASVQNIDQTIIDTTDSINGNEISQIQEKPLLDNIVVIDNNQNAEKKEKESCAIHEAIGTPFDCSTPHSSLKRLIASPLRKQIKKKCVGDAENIIKKALREQKMTVLESLNKLELEKIKTHIKHQNELHEQIILHNEEKHKLEMIKLQLEIDILQAQKEKQTNK